MQIGVGLSSYIEMCGLAPRRILGAIRYSAGGWEAATVRILPHGQGAGRHRDLAPRPGPRDGVVEIVADQLGRRPGEVDVLHGDTAIVPHGLDTYGSR